MKTEDAKPGTLVKCRLSGKIVCIRSEPSKGGYVVVLYHNQVKDEYLTSCIHLNALEYRS